VQEIAGDAPEAPALQGEIKVDVAIMGGGFVGLWTAHSIKGHEPACEVVVLEPRYLRRSASGRTAALSVLDVQTFLACQNSLHSRSPADRAGSDRRSDEMVNSAEEIESMPTSQRRLAGRDVGRQQLNAWEGVVRHARKTDVRAFERLDPAEVCPASGFAGSPGRGFCGKPPRGQPAALVRGAAARGALLGVRIFENTKNYALAGPPRWRFERVRER